MLIKRPLGQRLFYRVCWLIFKLPMVFWFRTSVRRLGRLPVDEGCIVLANHTSFFDPLWVGEIQWRPIRTMSSAALFRFPFLRALITGLGAFPKKKFVKDKESVLGLVEMVNDKQPVLIFPEGFRTWDGRTQPVLPGLGRLISRLGCPVVITRILTGHLIKPRWAHRFRFIPLHMEVDAPMRFPADATASEIEDVINQRLQIDPDAQEAGRFWGGWKRAEGLPAYLWACPGCFTLEGLDVMATNSNAVTCSSCGAAWEVDLCCRLQAVTEHSEAMTVSSASDGVLAHFGYPPVADPQRATLEGVVLDSPMLRIERLGSRDSQREVLAHGRARLLADQLEVHNPSSDTPWLLPLHNIQSVSVELANRLHLRVNDEVLAIDTGAESPLKWAHFLREHSKLGVVTTGEGANT